MKYGITHDSRLFLSFFTKRDTFQCYCGIIFGRELKLSPVPYIIFKFRLIGHKFKGTLLKKTEIS